MKITREKPSEFEVATWLNTDNELSLKNLRAKVVAVFTFQILCPGCVKYAIPQAKKIYEFFSREDLIVIGLHTVFEHHDAMGEISLKAFLHEYRVNFPVAIDKPSDDINDPIPKTMRKYQTQGTPTLLLFDHNGYLRKHKMGHEHDLVLGAELMTLIMEKNDNEN